MTILAMMTLMMMYEQDEDEDDDDNVFLDGVLPLRWKQNNKHQANLIRT